MTQCRLFKRATIAETSSWSACSCQEFSSTTWCSNIWQTRSTRSTCQHCWVQGASYALTVSLGVRMRNLAWKSPLVSHSSSHRLGRSWFWRSAYKTRARSGSRSSFLSLTSAYAVPTTWLWSPTWPSSKWTALQQPLVSHPLLEEWCKALRQLSPRWSSPSLCTSSVQSQSLAELSRF